MVPADEPVDRRFHYRFPFRRTHNPGYNHQYDRTNRQWRSYHLHRNRPSRKGLIPLSRAAMFYFMIVLAVLLFVLALMVLQSSMTSVFKQGRERRGRSLKEGLKFGSSLKFTVSPILTRKFAQRGDIELARGERRIAARKPRLALVLGSMDGDALSLLLFTMVKNLQELGYAFKIYAVENHKGLFIWEKISAGVTILSPDRYGKVEWSIFDGIIACSLEAKDVISSLMQEPFCSTPLIWIIHDDTLANRLPFYKQVGWEHLVSHWRSAFSRADVIAFPDYSLPMLYSVLDTENFFVIPASPFDVWAAERYSKTHLKDQLRADSMFNKDDTVILVVGSSFFLSELSCDYAVAMHAIRPLLIMYARRQEVGEAFKFVFLCGNSTSGYDVALQEVVSRLGLQDGSLRHHGMDGNVDGVILMADIVLYGSSLDAQSFPPFLTRAMSFEIPVIAPDFPVITKHVVDGVHAIIFHKHNPDDLLKSFSLLVSNGKVTKFARTVASSGRLLAKNMLATECIISYASLLENVIPFSSDVLLPGSVAQLGQKEWEWNLFNEIGTSEADATNTSIVKSGIVFVVEEDLTSHIGTKGLPGNDTDMMKLDIPTETDWEIMEEIESSEDTERREIEEIEERMGKNYGLWDDIYRDVRKAEKIKFEANERDEGELERTGQPLCIYEIYNGAGAWSFLHHGSMYRGLSLTSRGRRLRSDDVDAVSRLPILNDTFYSNILCEIGGMFSIANRVDEIHRRPWIGFQSWRATARKMSLSAKAEKILEETIQEGTKGDVIYFWAPVDMDDGVAGSNDVLTFWSRCEISNGGHCRNAFEDAFRRMYSLPSFTEALPPMPEDGGHWSALHSWLMPTSSFLEFIMFSRMFVDSLDALHISATNSSRTACLLGSSELEEKHCYCRVMDLLVNVWAYHSGRKMIYIDPRSGALEEQHPLELRRGFMWSKYFDFKLLKTMDEDLAEAADDNYHPGEMWLWPLTGEVHWQGIYEREREERYRLKMDKKRKTKEKLYERMKYGYRQKSLGG